MGRVRGLPRVTELDHCILRMTRNKYKEYFQCEIGVFCMTIGHEWKDVTELRDEPILMICVMDGNRSGAYELGRVFPPFQKGDTVIDQQYGSLKTQLFLRVDNIINKALRTAPGAWMMEIDRYPRGTHMRQIMVALNDDEALRTMAIIRMDPDRRNLEFDKWCIIMLSKGRSHEPYREIGPVLMREKSIISPTKRLKFIGKSRVQTRQTEDEGNLRFFDDIETSRSESRE